MLLPVYLITKHTSIILKMHEFKLNRLMEIATSGCNIFIMLLTLKMDDICYIIYKFDVLCTVLSQCVKP